MDLNGYDNEITSSVDDGYNGTDGHDDNDDNDDTDDTDDNIYYTKNNGSKRFI